MTEFSEKRSDEELSFYGEILGDEYVIEIKIKNC